jgi:hypothetical protein
VTAGSVTPVSDVHRPVFDQLERLTDGGGLFEHVLHTVPRREHGYCAGNAARGLVLLCREPEPRPSRRYHAFVLGARRSLNLGQGAESALATLATAQQACRIS